MGVPDWWCIFKVGRTWVIPPGWDTMCDIWPHMTILWKVWMPCLQLLYIIFVVGCFTTAESFKSIECILPKIWAKCHSDEHWHRVNVTSTYYIIVLFFFNFCKTLSKITLWNSYYTCNTLRKAFVMVVRYQMEQIYDSFDVDVTLAPCQTQMSHFHWVILTPLHPH